MKRLTRKIFAEILAMFARAVVAKYKPQVVMITGSVGKTSTKDAVASVVSENFFVRASEKSYNSEFGVPLTVLGSKNPWNSPLAWLRVFKEAFALLILSNHYPKVLVLEVGADRPGDLARILRIATPDVVVVTRLPALPVHVEAYTTPSAVREEEFAPAYALSPGAPLIVNADDEYGLALSKPLLASVSTYGLSDKADARIITPTTRFVRKMPVGMESTLGFEGGTFDLSVIGALGLPQLYAGAAAFLVGTALGMKGKDILKGLRDFVPPPGRGRILRGKNNAVIIDDSYNASPASVEQGLSTLALAGSHLESVRRIAVLGDMLELGRYSKDEHVKIGTIVSTYADVLVTVGMRSQLIAKTAQEGGMSETNIFQYKTAEAARNFLKDFIQKNDIVLIKGSQSVRTEKIVEGILFDPLDSDLLVRQDTEWRKR